MNHRVNRKIYILLFLSLGIFLISISDVVFSDNEENHQKRFNYNSLPNDEGWLRDCQILGALSKLAAINNVKSSGDADLTRHTKNNQYNYMNISLGEYVLSVPEIATRNIKLKAGKHGSWLSMSGVDKTIRVGLFEEKYAKFVDVVSAFYVDSRGGNDNPDYSINQRYRELSRALFGSGKSITELLSDSLEVVPTDIKCENDTGNSDFKKILLLTFKSNRHPFLVVNPEQVAAYKISRGGLQGVIAEVDGYGFKENTKNKRRIVVQVTDKINEYAVDLWYPENIKVNIADIILTKEEHEYTRSASKKTKN